MAEGQLNHGLRAGSRRIDDLDASLSSGFQIDVVNAHTRTTDDFEAITGSLQDLSRQLGGTANDDGIKRFQSTSEQGVFADVLKDHLVARFFKRATAFLSIPSVTATFAMV